MKNLLVAQSGGPTAAINSTLVGVIQKALISKDRIQKIYGGKNGIKGILEEQIIDITEIFSNPDNLSLLELTPSSALGSCRLKLNENDGTFEKIISIFKKYNIGYFVYIGGNDSMDTVAKLSNYCLENNIDDIKIMGAPKTIDNDLCETDFTPGFGSAAKYIGVAISEIICDVSVYELPCVTIVEIMGRNAGWLTASAALSKINGYKSPQLIYLPEISFDENKFINDINTQLKLDNNVVVCVSEGIKDKDGIYICERSENLSTDVFGHKSLAGTGKLLENLVRQKIGCKVRSIELNILQRCAGHLLSKTDLDISKLLGSAAFDYALSGETGKMARVKRLSNKPYTFEIGFVSIDKVANKEKLVPMEFINESHNNVNEKMIEYLFPLIQGECFSKYKNGMPEYIKII